MNENLILQGPDGLEDTSKESLGKQFLRCLRSRKHDDIVNIDGTTGEILTSRDVLEKSIKLTVAFKELGLKYGDNICIISENDINYFLVVLSAFYIGVTISPLNPEYTLNELRHGFQFSKSKVVVCSSTAIQNAIALKEEYDCISHIILLDNGKATNSNDVTKLASYIDAVTIGTDGFEGDDFDPCNTSAYILLSSGTTGLPKGVRLTHQNISTVLANLRDPRYSIIKPTDRLLTVLPFFHMFGNEVQLMTFVLPITTIILNKFKPETYLAAIEKYQPSKLIVVPPLISFMATHSLVEKYNMKSVQECLSSGSVIRNTYWTKITQKFPSLKIRQMYGITETGGFCLMHLQNSKEGNIGTPAPNTFIKVRDLETSKPLGPFESGEICIKGPMVMKEYVGSGADTQSSIDKDGFFCSGDIGYYDESRIFFIVGRMKEIIKYKSFQVSPTEVEQLILTHPLVQDCAVIGLPDEQCGELPLAFIVKNSNVTLTEEEIVNYVAERISRHKRLYGGVRFISEIPKNPSGKIMRNKLKELI